MPDRVDAPADGHGPPPPAPSGPPEPPARGAVAALVAWAGLLRQPGFRGLWLAQTVSQLGSQVTWVALPLVVFWPRGARPLEVGVLPAVDFLPFLLFTLPAGVWVDRLPRRRILI